MPLLTRSDDPSKSPAPTWGRVVWLEFLICILPPLGLWLLWKDPAFSRKAKIRMVTYTLLLPLLLYIAATLYLFDATERAITAAGGGY